MPFNDVEFIFNPEMKNNYNFSSNGEEMQFYSNMRYQSERISYRIEDICTLQKKADMERAFEIIETETILDFYPVITNEEIFVTCEDKIKVDERFFVAGEGGPTNITKTENFNVIFHGGILLLKDSDCERPNVAIHELLHALGFDHSQNPNNIMYNISKCSQTIGEDTTERINELYSIKPKADLSFENASAKMKGRYVNLDFGIRNNGLKNSEKTKIVVYADDEKINEVSVDPIKIGYGISINLGNVFVSKLSVEKIKIVIDSEFEELEKSNNEISLEIKNN